MVESLVSSQCGENLLLFYCAPGGQSRLHIERRKVTQSHLSFARDCVAHRRAFSFERALGKRRSDGRLFQESWPINFKGFSDPAFARSHQKEAGLGATHIPRIKCSRDRGKSPRRAAKICKGREACSD